jgi:hypothetical protein
MQKLPSNNLYFITVHVAISVYLKPTRAQLVHALVLNKHYLVTSFTPMDFQQQHRHSFHLFPTDFHQHHWCMFHNVSNQNKTTNKETPKEQHP